MPKTICLCFGLRGDDMTKTNVTSEYRDVVKIFNSLSGNKMLYQVFTDWVTMFACSISNAVDLHRFDKREEKYLKVADGYNENEMQKFCEISALITEMIEENPWRDTLGNLYMQLGMGAATNGQFFTPYHISYAMAQMSMPKALVERDMQEKGYITIYEPAVGGGANVIAACQVLNDLGINYQEKAVIVCQDLSRVTALMCYIVLSLIGAQAVIKIGDSLLDPYTNYANETGKKSDIWVSSMCALKGGHWKV